MMPPKQYNNWVVQPPIKPKNQPADINRITANGQPMHAIETTRLQPLQVTAHNPRARYVLYWMQQSQRVQFNHALEFAVRTANDRNQPLMVLFALTEAYPEANLRHYAFMLEGLQDVQKQLAARGIAFKIFIGDPVRSVLKAAKKASTLICDRGYLRHQRKWRFKVAHAAPCPVIQVESDVVVPVEAASPKAEYAARTIRPKIQRLLSDCLATLRPLKLKLSDPSLADPEDLEAISARLKIDRSVGPVSSFFAGGHASAVKQLKAFLERRLPDYDHHRNFPHLDGSSMMSPFFHFGHISPLEMVLAVQKSAGPQEAKETLLEELIVRRELAVNYAFYFPDYDRYGGLPQWARRTLAEHSKDRRDPIYTPQQLEAAATHDPYWNAAMLEMKHTGYMHTYMRMYWGKKILQWRPKPEDAFNLTLKLNNKYFIDGRDPNSFAGVGWIYGLHDQAWKERAIFGKIRYMARSGLERKFDMPGYLAKIKSRIAGLSIVSK
jgi:deoxyribodipyrimidine photo-lyase